MIERKKLILKDKDIVTIQRLLNDSFLESGLVKEQDTKSDAEEFLGGEKKERKGLLNKVIILYEVISDKSAGGHERELPQCKYKLDTAARKLQEAYSDYLDFVFHSYVTAKKSEKKDTKSSENIIDNRHVYVKEILLRLFTAAISIEKNNSNLAKEAKKIIDCLGLFLKKINNTSAMYDKPLLSFSSYISEINISFASEHKEWVYILKQMQEVVEMMHKHTATISKLMELLKQAKMTIALQLIAYLSKKDIGQVELLPRWIKYTLLDCQMAQLEVRKPKNKELAILHQTIAGSNFNSIIINEHQQKVIQCKNSIHIKDKLEKLYELLAKTNTLLAVLDQIDILLSTTGWVLIITEVLNLDGLSMLINNYGKEALAALQFDINGSSLKNKEEIKKSLIANEALSGIDFQQNLKNTVGGIKEIQSGIIKNCITDIVNTAIINLNSLQQKLNCTLINSAKLGISINLESDKNENVQKNIEPRDMLPQLTFTSAPITSQVFNRLPSSRLAPSETITLQEDKPTKVLHREKGNSLPNKPEMDSHPMNQNEFDSNSTSYLTTTTTSSFTNANTTTASSVSSTNSSHIRKSLIKKSKKNPILAIKRNSSQNSSSFFSLRSEASASDLPIPINQKNTPLEVENSNSIKFELLYDLAIKVHQNHDYYSSVGMLTLIIEMAIDSNVLIDCLIFRAQAHFFLNHFDDAFKDLEAALGKSSDTDQKIDIKFIYADMLFLSKCYEEALDIVNDILKIKADHKEAKNLQEKINDNMPYNIDLYKNSQNI